MSSACDCVQHWDCSSTSDILIDNLSKFQQTDLNPDTATKSPAATKVGVVCKLWMCLGCWPQVNAITFSFFIQRNFFVLLSLLWESPGIAWKRIDRLCGARQGQDSLWMERLSRHFLCLAVTEVKDRQRPLAVVGALPGKNQARAPVKCENSDSHQHL